MIKKLPILGIPKTSDEKIELLVKMIADANKAYKHGYKGVCRDTLGEGDYNLKKKNANKG